MMEAAADVHRLVVKAVVRLEVPDLGEGNDQEGIAVGHAKLAVGSRCRKSTCGMLFSPWRREALPRIVSEVAAGPSRAEPGGG
jgi:hypothetical protein